MNEDGVLEMPRKRFFRQRAHANPFSDHQLDYPARPEEMDWGVHYPDFVARDNDGDVQIEGVRKLTQDVEVADIGCGFGGLLVALSPVFPETLMLGESYCSVKI